MNSPRRPADTIGAGLEPLDVLPLFLRLRGRRAVVAGGSVGALWKARLLSAAGAEVHIFAPTVETDAPPVPVDGPITWHRRDWGLGDLDGAAIALAGLDDHESCAAFVREARARGAIANAIDRPELCDVQFGAIVNRSPLVVGISTGGAAPVFAQRVRSHLEALLPRGFAAWMRAAAAWRPRVMAGFPTALARRGFWDLFAERAFAAAERPPAEDDFSALAEAAGRDGAGGGGAGGGGAGRGGSVALVGAGPGDPELLTLKALRALRQADIVLYDDLVADEVLGFVRREARTMLVGKTGFGPSCRQDDINGLLVRLAGEGKRVVRLKGGDPLVFARAQEEIEACRRAGIPVEIVPGVTAAQGAAARLGVPLTHRDGARRVQLVTAHDRRGQLPELSWDAMADPTATTAIYMPRRRIGELVRRTLAAGLPPGTPAAAVIGATRDGERVVRATVADLPARLESEAPAGPMVVLIGEALRLADTADSRGLDEAPGETTPEKVQAAS